MKKVQAAGRKVWVVVKRPFRLSAGVSLSAESEDLLVLLPLYEASSFVQYRSRMSGEWKQLPWEPGTYVIIPWGCAVRVAPAGAVYGLTVIYTWRAKPSDRAESSGDEAE